MSKGITWIASYGTSRSHDSIERKVFRKKSDAVKYLERRPEGYSYWCISRIETVSPYSDVITHQAGGPDVEEEERRARVSRALRQSGIAKRRGSSRNPSSTLRPYEDFVWYKGKVWAYEGQPDRAGRVLLVKPFDSSSATGADPSEIYKVSAEVHNAVVARQRQLWGNFPSRSRSVR